jgi:hypothetical protein
MNPTRTISLALALLVAAMPSFGEAKALSPDEEAAELPFFKQSIEKVVTARAAGFHADTALPRNVCYYGNALTYNKGIFSESIQRSIGALDFYKRDTLYGRMITASSGYSDFEGFEAYAIVEVVIDRGLSLDRLGDARGFFVYCGDPTKDEMMYRYRVDKESVKALKTAVGAFIATKEMDEAQVRQFIASLQKELYSSRGFGYMGGSAIAYDLEGGGRLAGIQFAVTMADLEKPLGMEFGCNMGLFEPIGLPETSASSAGGLGFNIEIDLGMMLWLISTRPFSVGVSGGAQLATYSFTTYTLGGYAGAKLMFNDKLGIFGKAIYSLYCKELDVPGTYPLAKQSGLQIGIVYDIRKF